jgi:hypothetical protein
MTNIDMTKLLSKLIPDVGGEDVVRMRTGIVDAVNADGTVDLGIAGIIVPDIPRLASAVVSAGLVVNVISFRGSLLVIGAAATIAAQAPLIARGTVNSPSFTGNSFTVPVSFGVTFPSIPNVHINLNSSSGNWNGWTWMAYSITTTGFILLARSLSSSTPAVVPFQWTAIWTP